MWALTIKEFAQLRGYLLQIFGILAAAVLILGKGATTVVTSYLTVFPVVSALTLPQMSFGLEERGNTFIFLRALPIQPRAIVAAKYLLAAIVNIVFLGILAVAGAFNILSREATLATIATVAFASFTLSAISYFVHFWLGAKSARIGLLALISAIGLGALLFMRSMGGETELVSRLSGLEEVMGTPYGVAIGLGVGAIVLLASYAASSWIFTNRDLSRLP